MPTLPAPVPQRKYADPSDEPITCEVCQTVVRLGDSHSFVLGWGTTGPHNIAAFTCGGGKDGNGQHFCCSQACAIAAGHACIDEHLVPLHAHHVAVKQGALAAIAPPDSAPASAEAASGGAADPVQDPVPVKRTRSRGGSVVRITEVPTP